ncbi:outer membrane lipoprotein-sorting protein [candidate division KSB1 bacterium]|nr:outer membrane lipoprotein-sorting protein [candidate division KSB1 bacterium]RQW02590.1 MAG: outer membrane lipoprotein-sorting protein [candidate division KSB1 bacterium]
MKYFILILMLPLLAFSQEKTGAQIINKVNDLMNQESSEVTMTMTIITSSGQERTFEYLSYSVNFGEKNLIIYQAPSRVKGQKMLMLNQADDIWAYFPRTQRVRKLATHAKKQKFEGSDFSNEDLGSGDSFTTDYNAQLIDEENKAGYDCYVVELTRNPRADISYSRLIVWVRKSDYVPLIIDYYDDKNPDRLLKTLSQSNIQIIDGVPTAMRMIMHNHSDNTSTTVEIKKVKYNVPLDDELFTERGLKK